jgi:hypothetical protein
MSLWLGSEAERVLGSYNYWLIRYTDYQRQVSNDILKKTLTASDHMTQGGVDWAGCVLREHVFVYNQV